MNEEEFRKKLEENGYIDPYIYEAEPGPVREMHTHDDSNMSLVLRGEFTLITENRSKTYQVGDWCENPAGTMHTEKFGPEGVTVLIGTK